MPDISRKAAYSVLAGLVLLAGSQAGIYSIPQGASEFAYAPFTPAPMPFSPMRGFTVEQLADHLFRVLLATPGLLLLAFGLRGVAAGHGPGGWRPVIPRSLHPRLALVASVGSLAFMAWLMFFVFRGRAIIDDELTYRMQAMMLADGVLGRTAPPLAFLDIFSIRAEVGVTGKYYPGEPLVQLPGALIGYPALGHLPLAALTLLLLYHTARMRAGRVVASWAVILLACSPMFLFSTPTGQSVPTSLFCVVAAAFGYTLLRAGRSWTGALILGAAVGFGMMVRPQAVAPAGAVLVAGALLRLLPRGRLWPAAALCLTLAAWAALMLVYNREVTGAALTMPWALIKPVEQYGFGKVWEISSYRHTLWTALENLGVVSLRFNAWWLGWPSSLVLAWLWYRNGRPLDGAVTWCLVGLAIILFEAGYYSTGVSDTGCVYHYELLAPAAVLGANALRQGFVAAPRLTVILLVVSFGLGSSAFLVYQTQRITRLVHAIHADTDAALARVRPPAVIYYDVRCSETLEVGWIHTQFPRRLRSPRDGIVAYPRPPVAELDAHRAHFKDRACWYYRRNPDSGKPELYRCEEARALLRRAYGDSGRDYCLSLKSTAEILGWYDPWTAIYSSLATKKKKRELR